MTVPGNDAHAVPMLIAGAGPAGLTTAIALARQGVPSLIVERRTELSSLPRATVLSTRSMELLRGADSASVMNRRAGVLAHLGPPTVWRP